MATGSECASRASRPTPFCGRGRARATAAAGSRCGRSTTGARLGDRSNTLAGLRRGVCAVTPSVHMPFNMLSRPAGIDRLDDEIGVRVANAVCSHHARRLRNLGKHALEAPPGGWAEDATPPRLGNRLDVLVDGEQLFDTLLEELAAARSHVHMTGWYMSPDFVLRHGDTPVVLRNLLAALAARVDVRILLWAGSPAPVFTPSRRDTARAAEELRAGSDAVHVLLDRHERPMHCHHEKTIVIDDRVAFVGGIDLTELAGDRLDSTAHPA